MAYILDNKKPTSASSVTTVENTSVITNLVDTQIKAELSIGVDDNTKYKFPTTKAPGTGYTLEDTKGDGTLQWVPSASVTGSGNPSFTFARITDNGTNYLLSSQDYAVEIVSDTYNTVVLPSAANIGGRVYLISRASNNDTFKVVAQPGETIDGDQEFKYLRKYTRMTLMSNDVSEWYII